MTAMEIFEALHGRRSVGKLAEPGPDRQAIRQLLAAAVTAPDHGSHHPWRFVVLAGAARERLGDAFAAAARARRPGADDNAIAADRAKPLRAPVLIAVILKPVASVKAPEWEQLASAAAATQNLLLAAHGAGWGAMWRTGWFVDADEVRTELDLAAAERLVGLIYLGTPAAEPPPRPAVALDELITWRMA